MNEFLINWKLKSFIYKILFFFKAHNILFFIQKKITKRANIDIFTIDNSWKYHLKNLQYYDSKKILEFGAGKSLEQNIFLNYNFNSKLHQTVIDESNMLDIGLFNEASSQISKIIKIQKKSLVHSIEEIEKFYNIKYLAPYDMEKIKKNEMIFDACISTATLEHFPLEDLEKAFKNLKKIIKKNGIISSTIDYSDHYSHTDDKINSLNFLQYDKNTWKKYNTPYLFQNRLRHQDYRDFFLKMNYEIVEENQGEIGKPPKIVSNEFDANNKETYILWGQFLLKNSFKNE